MNYTFILHALRGLASEGDTITVRGLKTGNPNRLRSYLSVQAVYAVRSVREARGADRAG